jgi:hypothetical protein
MLPTKESANNRFGEEQCMLADIRWLGSGKSGRDVVRVTDKRGMKEARLEMSHK